MQVHVNIDSRFIYKYITFKNVKLAVMQAAKKYHNSYIAIKIKYYSSLDGWVHYTVSSICPRTLCLMCKNRHTDHSSCKAEGKSHH